MFFLCFFFFFFRFGLDYTLNYLSLMCVYSFSVKADGSATSCASTAANCVANAACSTSTCACSAGYTNDGTGLCTCRSMPVLKISKLDLYLPSNFYRVLLYLTCLENNADLADRRKQKRLNEQGRDTIY